jgi:hypothetical protein
VVDVLALPLLTNHDCANLDSSFGHLLWVGCIATAFSGQELRRRAILRTVATMATPHARCFGLRFRLLLRRFFLRGPMAATIQE